MRYTLKDYQAEAVRDVLRNLERARDSYRRYGALSQFSLTATTGAGKTVMAAAVIESLFSVTTSLTSRVTQARSCYGSRMTPL